MAKKLMLVFVVAVFVKTGAFAQVDFSAGAGIHLGPAVFVGDFSDASSAFEFGFHSFFDATFVELGMGLGWQTSSEDWGDGNVWITTQALEFTLLGKFPFEMGDFGFSNVTVFPMAGLGFGIPLSHRLSGGGYSITITGSDVRNPNMSLIFGAGADIDLPSGIFIRPSLLFNMNFAPFGEDYGSGLMSVGVPRFRIAAGYRF